MKTILITGASDGIGAAAARELYNRGNEVILVGRSAEKTKAIARELKSKYYLADFADLDSVRKLAKAIKKDYKTIDVVALNAGGIFAKRKLTKDGNEMTFQVNHLAHFLLIGLLMDTLIKSHATIVTTASSANYLAKLDLNDLSATKSYGKWTTYGNAKLMNILFARELVRRYGKRGISAAAFHPGVVATSFARDLGPVMKKVFTSPVMHIFGLKSPAQGADTLVWLATSDPDKDWKPGGYFVSRRLRHASSRAYKVLTANELWNRSEDLLRDTLEY